MTSAGGQSPPSAREAPTPDDEAEAGGTETTSTADARSADGTATAAPADGSGADSADGASGAGGLERVDGAGDANGDGAGGAGGAGVVNADASGEPDAAGRGGDRDDDLETAGAAAGPGARYGGPVVGRPQVRGISWLLVGLLIAVGLVAGFAAKAPCIATYPTPAGPALDWREGRQYTYVCYSDTIPLYGLERLSEGDFPYQTSWLDNDGVTQRYMEYPVLTGLLQYSVMRATKAWVGATDGDLRAPDPPEVVVYFVIMALVLAVAWAAAVATTVPLLHGPGKRWKVALLAASPLVIVHVFTNFDALAVALACGGMLAWTRRRPGLAGLLLGLGAAAKLYPLFILGPLLLLGLRTGRLRGWAVAAVAAAGAWLAVNAPIALLYPDGWREFFRLNSTRPADHDTVYFAIRTLFGWEGFDGLLPPGEPPRVLNAITLLLFAIVCAAVTVIALTAPRRPRVASLTFLVVAGFLLTNKVWSPQYSLWLVPLAVLAIARWRPLLAWMAIDAAIWWPRMQYFLHFDQRTTETFVIGVLIRDVVVLALCALVIRDIYKPEKDPIRQAGADDPCGGEYENREDTTSRWQPRKSQEPATT